jgi:hypothetical protein
MLAPAAGMPLASGTPLACTRRWHRPCYAQALAWTLLVARALLGARLAWSLLARAAGMVFAWCAAGTLVACGTPLACVAQLAWTLLGAAQCAQRCPNAAPKQPACHRAGAALRCAPLGRCKGPCAPVAPRRQGLNAAAGACAQCPLYMVCARQYRCWHTHCMYVGTVAGATATNPKGYATWQPSNVNKPLR